MGASQSVERLSYSVDDFMAASGISRRKIYEAIATGSLKTFKNGKRRMISADAARQYIGALERATRAAEAA
jgi:hypothetical protein